MATDDQQQSHGGQAVDNTSQEHHRQSIVDKDSNKKRPILDRSLGTAAGLSKMLPSGTTLAFQTMAPSFTRGGECVDHDVNFAFSCGLIVFLTLLTAALSFTDSVTAKDGKTTYYGWVTSKGLRLFNGSDELVRQSKVDKDQLKLRRTEPEDLLHAVVSAAVFLALAFCDAGVQRCLVNEESRAWKDFFNHLPLAVGFLASFVFIVFPTTRNGIGDYSGALDEPAPPPPPADSNKAEISAENKSPAPPARPAAENNKNKASLEAKTLLGAAATLSKLLPTGTTLAFQTMAPSFTNGGDCAGHRVNLAFTWGLIGFLALMCAALSFTDSVTDMDGHTYFLHAVVSPAVFATVAFCDAGVQDCLVPKESTQWREFLALLPLTVAFLASFLFFIFPSDRNGIGEEGDAAFWHLPVDDTKADQHDEVSTPSPDKLLISSPGPGHGQHPHNQISCCVCVRA